MEGVSHEAMCYAEGIIMQWKIGPLRGKRSFVVVHVLGIIKQFCSRSSASVVLWRVGVHARAAQPLLVRLG